MKQHLLAIYLIGSLCVPSIAFPCDTGANSDQARRWSELNLAAQKASADGDLARARTLFEQASVEAGARHLEIERAATLNDLGLLYRSGKEFEKAESALGEASAVRERRLGVDAECTGVTLNNLAELYFDEGRLDLAESTYKRALKSAEASGSDPLHTATVFNNLGAFYYAQQRFGDAEPYFVRALDAYRKVQSKGNTDDPGIRLMKSLAEANGDAPERLEDARIRDLTEALMRGYLENHRYSDFRKLYVQFQKSENSPETAAHVARVFAATAVELAGRGRSDDAEAMFNRALGAFEAAGEIEGLDARATQAKYVEFRSRRKDRKADH